MLVELAFVTVLHLAPGNAEAVLPAAETAVTMEHAGGDKKRRRRWWRRKRGGGGGSAAPVPEPTSLALLGLGLTGLGFGLRRRKLEKAGEEA